MKLLCRRPPIPARPRRVGGVTGWARTSYSGVTARGLSTSPSATSIGTAGAIRTHKFLLLRELPLPDSATAAWIHGEPYGCRSHHDGLKDRLPRRLLTVRVW